MKSYSVMIKPASSLCNLKCSYCFYKDVASLRDNASYGIMKEDLVDRTLTKIEEELTNGDSITFAFQGGEPTLAGFDWFHHFTNQLSLWNKKININLAFQTNGILIDDFWCKWFKENNVLVGVSYDMVADIHNHLRCDSTKKVLNGIALLEKYEVDYNILSTLTKELAKHPMLVFNEMKKHNFKYVQFTPCLSDFNMDTPYALTPDLFFSFYKTIFDLWYKEFMNNNYYSIKLFDDIVNLLAYHIPTCCGINGICSPQIVVEADGSVYPCDFYCLDEYKIGKIDENTLQELWNNSISSPQKEKQELSSLCKTCPFVRICNGNCKRMIANICYDEKENSCGYQEFLKYSIDRFLLIAKIQHK